MPKAEVCKTLEEAKEKWPEIPLGKIKLDKLSLDNYIFMYRTNNNPSKTSRIVCFDKENKIYKNCYVMYFSKKYKANKNSLNCKYILTSSGKPYRGEDLTGKKFGELTCLFVTDKTSCRDHYWVCRCDCGKLTSVASHNLKRGNTKRCKFHNHRIHNNVDYNTYIGKKFNSLTCLEIKEKKQKKQYMLWQCDCGKLKKINLYDVLRGHTKSCGCLRGSTTPFKDLTGIKFGHLTVLSLEPKEKNKPLKWLCQCDCKNKTLKIIRGTDLKSGATKSCGCISSRGNENISILLSKENFSFIKEYKNENCKDKRALPFDFYINNKYIIEYDGEQHFKAVNYWGGEEQLNVTHEHDLIKNKYCFDNNIPLIRIPYDADYTIDDLKLETTRFLLTPENEKEYYESRK